MDNIKNYLGVAIVIAVAVVAVVSGVVIFQKVPIVQNTVNVPESPLGAIPGTSVDSQIFTIGGVEKGYINTGFLATSSVLCAIQNPFRPATTSIDRITVKRTTSFAGATSFDISTSSTQFGSSTLALIRAKAVAAGNLNTTLWTPRSGTTTNIDNVLFWAANGSNAVVADSPYFLTGNEWITVRNATGTPGSETPRGVCNFEFTKF